MTEIEKQTANKAVQLLAALKAEYKIILPDGTEFGTLETKNKTKKKSKGERTRIPNGIIGPLYKEKVLSAKVGDVIQLSITNLPNNITPEMLRSSATAFASGVWGYKTYTSTITKHNVEILRIG